MITEKHLKDLTVRFLGDSDKFLVELSVKPGNRIMVFIDGDQGVTIDDCQKLSRFLEQNLDRDKEDFDLMVSSAGADRSLVLPRQYNRRIGKKLEVVVTGGTKMEGILLSAGNDEITIEQQISKSKKETETKSVVLKYTEIKSAKVALSFKH